MNSIDTIPSGSTGGALSDLKAVKLSDEAMKALREAVDAPPVGTIDADNDPSKLYATIRKDGRTIATLYTSGLLETPSDVAMPQDLAIQGHGLALADTRIKQMLAAHGGSVRYAHAADTRNPSIHAATLFAAQIAGQ